MSERLKLEGRLSEAMREARALRLQIEGLVRGMRDNLDLYTDMAELRLDMVLEQAAQAFGAQEDLRRIVKRMKDMERDLGAPGARS